MQKNTATRTATTFTLADRHPNFRNLSAEDLEIIGGAYVWKNEGGARDAVRMMIDVNGYEYTHHTAPGVEVYAFYVNGEMLTVIIFEDDTAVRLHKTVRREQPVTITYVKADGEETVRTIEPTGLSLTKAGDVIVKALDRKSGETRSFRLDRIRTYTVHRTRRTVRTEAPAPTKAQLWEQWTERQQETVTCEWDVYDTTPGTATALEAPEAVQDRLAEAYASGHRYAFVTV